MRSSLRRWRFHGETWLVVAAIRAALWFLPFGSVERLARRLGRTSARAGPGPPPTPEAIEGAVGRAARLVPRANCLTRALAMRVLLARAGRPAELRIGVRQGLDGTLRAHAWLESMGRVIGKDGTGPFVPLRRLEETPR